MGMILLNSNKKSSSATGTLVQELIKNKKWRDVRRIVASNKHLTITCKSQGRCSPIFYACKYNPPSQVIKSMLKSNPSAASEIDSKKNSPLHIACQFGASAKVIKVLLEANKDAVRLKNIEGMLPIHKVSRYYSRSARAYLNEERISDELEDIFMALLSLYPESILDEDDEEKCPIEHALEGRMQVDLIHSLQARSESERILQYKNLHN